MRRLVVKDYKVVAKLTSKPEIENVKGYDIIVVCTDHGKFSNFVNAVDTDSNDYRSWEILLPVEFRANTSSVEKIG